MQAVLAQLPLSSCSMSLIEVEHIVAKAGIDIGDTAIGMHVKHVQIPIRPSIKSLGAAHVTALGSRPKYIGGPRAHYATISESYNNRKALIKKKKHAFACFFCVTVPAIASPFPSECSFFTIFFHSILWQLFLLQRQVSFWCKRERQLSLSFCHKFVRISSTKRKERYQ